MPPKVLTHPRPMVAHPAHPAVTHANASAHSTHPNAAHAVHTTHAPPAHSTTHPTGHGLLHGHLPTALHGVHSHDAHHDKPHPTRVLGGASHSASSQAGGGAHIHPALKPTARAPGSVTPAILNRKLKAVVSEGMQHYDNWIKMIDNRMRTRINRTPNDAAINETHRREAKAAEDRNKIYKSHLKQWDEGIEKKIEGLHNEHDSRHGQYEAQALWERIEHRKASLEENAEELDGMKHTHTVVPQKAHHARH